MKNIIIIISILFITNLSAQFPTLVEKNSFENFEISSLIKTKNGSFVLTGFFCPILEVNEEKGEEINYKNRLWSAELDQNGKTIWSKILTDGIKDSIIGKYIAEGNSGFLILTKNLGNNQHQLVKINNSGDILWKKNVGKSSKLISANKGGYILLGKYNKENNWIYKLNENGEEQWKISMSQFNNQKMVDVINTIDYQYIVLAYDINEIGEKKWNLVKFNDEGEITWKKKLVSNIFANSDYKLGNFIQDKLGNYIIATTEKYVIHSDIRITKVNEKGAILYSKLYGFDIGKDKPINEIAYGIIEAENGGYIFGGRIYEFATSVGGDVLCLFRIDENGNFLWFDSYRKFKYNNIISFQTLNDNKYFIGLTSNWDDERNKNYTFILSLTDNFDAKYDPMLCPLVE